MNIYEKTLDFLHYYPGSSRPRIMVGIDSGVSDSQMKRLMARGIADGDIRVEGRARATRYFLTPKAHLLRTIDLASYYAADTDHRRVQTGYNFELIREILPAVSLFSESERAFLAERHQVFLKHMDGIPAGIYQRELERLGIDLSWKSSEIEGNTYTLLETETLLKELKEAEGKKHEEALMLLNHKEALKAILAQSEYFRRVTLARMEDIHSILVEGLGVERSLRFRRVGISGTNYRPLEIESQIREAVEDMCVLVNGKDDAYEKALLLLLLIAYIQPFNDGNKRTSRLVSNAVLLAYGHCPLSFRSVSANDYRAALLLFYEQNNLSAFKRIFLDQVDYAVRSYF